MPSSEIFTPSPIFTPPRVSALATGKVYSGLDGVGLDIEGVIMTMYDYRTNLSNEVYEEAKKFFNDKVYKTTIARNIRLAEAPSFGLPIMLYDEKCKGADAYKRFAKEFLSKQ